VTELSDACEKEIIGLHRFFESWFTAAVEKNEEIFKRVTNVLHGEFALIFPTGELLERENVKKRVYQAHGLESSNPRYFRIWIDKVRCRFEWDDRCLMTFEEWHEDNGSISARLSSAWFRVESTMPNGVQWLHLHETWLPGKETHVRKDLDERLPSHPFPL
jgi:hypothetical protein